MGIVKDVQELLAGVPINPVLRERLQLVQDTEKTLKDRIRALEEENADLKKAVCEMAQQIQTHAALAEYVEHAGALFKRKPGGGYHLSVYCPSCKKPASTIGGMIMCAPCSWIWAHKPGSIHRFTSELEQMDKTQASPGEISGDEKNS